MSEFVIKNSHIPAGDQPQAIEKLVDGVRKGLRYQTLLGVTGSGKTFTMANVIAAIGKPTLVIAHNKTLAAQLAQEYKEFFPDNAVHYFVSYYDFYQPEAYMPASDTYIEKDAQINEEIDRLRHASTQALLSRKDVIIVASVSCIYGLGSPKDYAKEHKRFFVGMQMPRRALMEDLVAIFYERTSADLSPGQFRSIGNVVEIMPVSERVMYRLELTGNTIDAIVAIDPVSGTVLDTPAEFYLYPAKHFLADEEVRKQALKSIEAELKTRLAELEAEGKSLDAERLRRRTNHDLALIREVGYCNGIENYSRHLSGKKEGEAADTLLAYFPHKPDGTPDFLTIIDESHMTIPQIGGMYAGDRSRKKTLVEYGFRLPSAMDNRPLRFEEFTERTGTTIYTTATPGNYEKEVSMQVVEQIIRPTGLVDPQVDVRPVTAKGAYEGQIRNFIAEAKIEIAKGNRVIANTLTKRMAEDLSGYLKEEGIIAEYLHSDVKTIERIKILTEFRKGADNGGFDCLVGVNLLREGLDLPEVTFIAILDADKEGFLRSETALIQTIGRAARNVDGRVVLYADTMTGSMERALSETNRRRVIQLAYNKEHGITPQTIKKRIHDITDDMESDRQKAVRANLETDAVIFAKDPKKLIKLKESLMADAVKELDFETAAILRDEIKELKEKNKK
ncbi:MAG: excinuclease ABC subunit UvrB [Candidatus Yonathbacteria bacterium]|nr:excinuclease ABC subunit UvrB [Candidatus Yonathbacteria bacterium]